MRNKLIRVALFAAVSVMAQDHKWAGRTLDNFEWSIHEKLAERPSYGVFDSVRFEVAGKVVTLSGQVVKENLKHGAERLAAQVNGVEKVINQIEVLPSSRRDDALRMNVYRAIYEKQPLGKYEALASPPIHIIVKDGWVTLEGVVDSEAERSAVRLRASNASSHVSDHLRVAPEGI
jgi:hyperosmotically inducible periplasmic protein